MHSLIQPKQAKSLTEALKNTGHLWWFEKTITNALPGNIAIPAYQDMIVGTLLTSVTQWANTDVALRPFATRQGVRAAVADIIARTFNIDIDGRSADLPKNRAQEVQEVPRIEVTHGLTARSRGA